MEITLNQLTLEESMVKDYLKWGRILGTHDIFDSKGKIAQEVLGSYEYKGLADSLVGMECDTIGKSFKGNTNDRLAYFHRYQKGLDFQKHLRETKGLQLLE